MSFFRFIPIAAVFAVLAAPSYGEESHVPWPDGEKLTYDIHWSALPAAQGVFRAIDHADQWQFELELKSRGVVDAAYPIHDWYWSIQQKNPWRSVEYGEDRSEGKRRIKERTRVDYTAGQAVRERWTQDKVDKFAVTGQTLDDVGSMLYSIRLGSWALHDKRTMNVYESSSVKQGEVECVAIEERAVGEWPKQKLIKLHAEPTGGDKKKGSFIIWMTDDNRRLPIRAFLVFKYGAFTIDLVNNGIAAK